MDNTKISEREFLANENRKLQELSQRIDTAVRDFHLNNASLAKACHLDRRIVRRARAGIRINGDCERRIEYYIEKLYKYEMDNH